MTSKAVEVEDPLIDPSLESNRASLSEEEVNGKDRSVLTCACLWKDQANDCLCLALSSRLCTAHRAVLWSVAKCKSAKSSRDISNSLLDQPRSDRYISRDSGYILAANH